MDELGEVGRGGTFGTTPAARPAPIGTAGDGRDYPDLTHNPEVVGSNPTPATRQSRSSDIVRGAVFMSGVAASVASAASSKPASRAAVTPTMATTRVAQVPT